MLVYVGIFFYTKKIYADNKLNVDKFLSELIHLNLYICTNKKKN